MSQPSPGSRSPRVLILGLPYFGNRLAADLRARGWDALFLEHPGRRPSRWLSLSRRLGWTDALYLISARAETRSPLDRLLRVFRKPVVIHWVGTDVLIAAEEYARGRLSPRVAASPAHWCDTPWLVDELAAIGIRARLIALPVGNLARGSPPPLPVKFHVLMYLPVDAFDREVFDVETILALPAAFPSIRFTLIPSPAETLPVPLPPNLEARSWVADMDGLYGSISCYIRLTDHDGTPFTVLEALSRGRHVIFTHPMPATRTASGVGAVARALRNLIEEHEAGVLGINEAGVAYVARNYDHERLTRELSRQLWQVLQAGRYSGARPPPGQFSA